MRLSAFLPAMVLAACAPTAAQTDASARQAIVQDDKLSTALAGLVPGESYTCLPEATGTRYQSQGYGKTILYKVNKDLIYRSDTAGGCERIARGDILITRQYSGRQCAGDIATTVDPIAQFVTGTCSFAPFVQYKRPAGS